MFLVVKNIRLRVIKSQSQVTLSLCDMKRFDFSLKNCQFGVARRNEQVKLSCHRERALQSIYTTSSLTLFPSLNQTTLDAGGCTRQGWHFILSFLLRMLLERRLFANIVVLYRSL